jgi:hypothetical protein
MRRAIPVVCIAAVAALISAQALATALQPSTAADTDAIVVSAQRSGIPVWRVDGPRSTLVLVGTISDVAEGTPWNSASLLAALRGADRVMFPASVQYTASIFTIMQLQAKGRKLATLPKGHTVAEYVSPADYQRLESLQRRGILKPGFERKHPRQIVQELIQYAKGERPSMGFFSIERVHPETDPEAFVRSALRKYKIPLVPLATAKLKPSISDVFSANGQANERCLKAAMDLADAGPSAVTARSRAWARRDVPAALSSVAERTIEECRPASVPRSATAQVRSTLRALLNDPRTTVAVIDLPLLAQPGGLLDDLSAAGFKIQGPAWK